MAQGTAIIGEIVRRKSGRTLPQFCSISRFSNPLIPYKKTQFRIDKLSP